MQVMQNFGQGWPMKHVAQTLYTVSSILKSNNYTGNVVRAPSCIGFFYEFSRRCFCICYVLNYGHGFLNAQERGWDLAAQVSNETNGW